MLLPDTLFNLPTHALLVHGAVVLVPLAAVALVATGWRSDWRRTYSLPVAILAVAGGCFALLAQQSGGPLKRSIRDAAARSGERVSFGDHPQQGNNAMLFAVALAAVALVYWAIVQFGPRRNLPNWAPTAAYAVTGVVAVLATVGILLAGHSGATLVWRDVGSLPAGR
jgi:hypothetical protein